MHTIIRTITHFNYAGILSMLAVGILGFSIPEEILPMLLGSIVSRRCAHWICRGPRPAFYPNRLPLAASNASLMQAQGAIKATYPNRLRTLITSSLAVILITWACAQMATAQVSYPPGELDQLVSRIALYADPLLAQILAAATYPDQIPDAATWADQHHYLAGDELARAIEADHLPWDPSVQALLPFPSVLEMMASDMAWTNRLGDAVLAQHQDVMDAIQRMRQKAKDYGYLRSNAQIIVSDGPYITILPADPSLICVPAYDPFIVFAPPPPGFFVGAAIQFGFGVRIGLAFRPWGWGTTRILWDSHAVIVNNVRWDRVWMNRARYIHPYPRVVRYEPGRTIERHPLMGRTLQEREAARSGHAMREVHRRR